MYEKDRNQLGDQLENHYSSPGGRWWWLSYGGGSRDAEEVLNMLDRGARSADELS